MTKRKPIAGTAAMTKLQQEVLSFLMKNRFYNRQNDLPTALVGQWELADTLQTQQSQISETLKQLTARKLIEKTGKPKLRETQLYTICHPAHATQPDNEQRRQMVDDHPAGTHQRARLRAAKAERFAKRGNAYQDRKTLVLRDGTDDNQTQAEAEATATEMLREDPELEGPWEALQTTQSAPRPENKGVTTLRAKRPSKL